MYHGPLAEGIKSQGEYHLPLKEYGRYKWTSLSSITIR